MGCSRCEKAKRKLQSLTQSNIVFTTSTTTVLLTKRERRALRIKTRNERIARRNALLIARKNEKS